MSMKVEVSMNGLDDAIRMLQKLTDDVDPIFKRTLYKGMDVVADTMRESVKALKTDKVKKGKRYCTVNEKKGLIESFGVTPIKFRDGVYDVKAGFDGYNEYIKSHPANPMIANFVNRGTSYMKAQPFISRTERAARLKSIDAMTKALDEEIKKRTH